MKMQDFFIIIFFFIVLMELIFLNELKRLAKRQDFCCKCGRFQVSSSADSVLVLQFLTVWVTPPAAQRYFTGNTASSRAA